MNDLDQRIRQLMQEIGDNSQAPPDWAPSTAPSAPARTPRRPMWLAAAAIVIVIAGVAAIALVATHDTGSAPTVDTAVDAAIDTVARPTTSAPTATTPRSTSTTVAPVEHAPTLTPITVGTPLPAPLELVPFASVDLPAGSGGPESLPPVAALSGGRAVIVDADRSELVIIDVEQRRVPITTEYAPFMLTGGPGDVVYGITPSPTETDAGAADVVAFSVASDGAGTIVGSAPTGMNQFMEAEPTILAHGPDGVVNRRVGDALLPYVDDSGDTVSLDVPAPLYEIDDSGLVADLDGTPHWQLAIQRQPGYAGAYVTDAPPSSLSDGRAVYGTAIGPPAIPGAEATTPTLPVVALLRADGTGTWYSLVDGWTLVAADLDGLIFARRSGDTIELATPSAVDVPICESNLPFEATTLPGGFDETLHPGSGGQVTIAPDGDLVPIEPTSEYIHHYRGAPGSYIDLFVGGVPVVSTSSPTAEVEVLGTSTVVSEIEDGFIARFPTRCGDAAMTAFGITRDEFISVLQALAPT